MLQPEYLKACRKKIEITVQSTYAPQARNVHQEQLKSSVSNYSLVKNIAF